MKLEFLPLSYRREILGLKFLHKCLNSELDFDIHKYITFTSNRTRAGGASHLLHQPKFNTESHAHSFINRITPLWNLLAQSLREERNKYAFNRMLNEFYWEKVRPNFDCDKKMHMGIKMQML